MEKQEPTLSAKNDGALFVGMRARLRGFGVGVEYAARSNRKALP